MRFIQCDIKYKTRWIFRDRKVCPKANRPHLVEYFVQSNKPVCEHTKKKIYFNLD